MKKKAEIKTLADEQNEIDTKYPLAIEKLEGLGYFWRGDKEKFMSDEEYEVEIDEDNGKSLFFACQIPSEAAWERMAQHDKNTWSHIAKVTGWGRV